ncbi:hypothetical protein [Coleofasciculus sp.]|uniref:hypothetical protein n=1 Tax=Coleofasciculus sp. TaxID=3100458 RepID=UPI0039F82D67
MHIAFTGSRQITPAQREIIEHHLAGICDKTISYHVGDANGVDSVVRDKLHSQKLTVYRAEGHQPWQLAQRSKRMVQAIANSNAKLIAFPNKPCPKGVKPLQSFSGKGSGTWGTVALAKYHGLAIEVVPLVDGLTLPDWLTQPDKQLSLF